MRHVTIVSVLAVLLIGGCDGSPSDPSDVGATYGSLAPFGNCPAFASTQICICTADNFLGTCSVLTAGGAYDTPAMGIPNDSMKSLVVGANATAALFDSGGFRWGVTDVWHAGPGTVAPSNGAHFGVSSIRVDYLGWCKANGGAGCVKYCTDGGSLGDCAIRPVNWAAPNWQTMGVPDNWISSVVLEQGTAIDLYRDSNYGGSVITIGPNPYPGAPQVYSLNSSWNDQTSSLYTHF